MWDVVIVSFWGRGAWLAHQLQKNAFRTTVFDISPLYPLSSAEREGPFGVFLPSYLSDLQKSYLCGDHFYSVQQGFSLFTSQGPLELRGTLSSFFKETWPDFQIGHSILYPFDMRSSFLQTPVSELQSLFGINSQQSKKVKESIKPNVFLSLAKQFSCSYLEQNFLNQNKVKEKASSLGSFSSGFSPLFSEYLFRESSQRYFMDIKDSLKKEGVEWMDISVADLSSSDNFLRDFKSTKKNVEFKWNGETHRSKFLIWTLSGPETLQFFSDSMPFLFPEWKPPMKIWKRFSLSWNQGAFEKVIPFLLFVLPDYKRKDHLLYRKELSSGMEYFLSLKRHPEASKMDLWILCPYADRFNKSILSSYLRTALEHLNCLFPGFSITADLPEQETCHDYFVLYKKTDLFNKKSKYKQFQDRLFHLNPESAGKMDAYSLMWESSNILESLLKTKDIFKFRS